MARLNGNFDADQRDALRTGIEARARVHGIDVKAAVDQMAGSFVGRLCLAGRLTEQQHEAARMYLADWHNMLAAVHGPRSPGAVNLNATKGEPGAENEAFAIDAMARWKTVCGLIQDRQNISANRAVLAAALNYCVIRDEGHEHMVPWLRIALGELATHYKVGDKVRQSAKVRHPALT